jgi:hypothetical protein
MGSDDSRKVLAEFLAPREVFPMLHLIWLSIRIQHVRTFLAHEQSPPSWYIAVRVGTLFPRNVASTF